MLGGRSQLTNSPDQLLSSSGKKADHLRHSPTAVHNPFFQGLIFHPAKALRIELDFWFYIRVYIQIYIYILVSLLFRLRIVSVTALRPSPNVYLICSSIRWQSDATDGLKGAWSVSLSLFLSFSLCFSIFLWLSTYLRTDLSVYLSICLSVYLSPYLSIYLPIYLAV